MSNKEHESLPVESTAEYPEQQDRRVFLVGLGKWSKAVIGGVLLGGALAPGQSAEAWSNRGGSGGIWYNSGDGWGGWVERPWDWNDGPRRRPPGYDEPYWNNRPRWHNRPHWNDDWYNRRPWYNGGWYNSGWYNR